MQPLHKVMVMPKNHRSIPEIRVRLLELSEAHDIPELAELVDEMYRQSPIRRAPVTSKTLTPALAAEIRRYARQNPSMSQQDIANNFTVNPGRVSDSMNRKK